MKLRHILKLSLTPLLKIRSCPGFEEFRRQYRLEQELGRGGYGTVHSATRKSDGVKVAVKEISKDDDIAMKEDIPLEIVLLQQVADVPGVVRILDYFETKHSFLIVMEKFNGQDLFDYISKHGTLSEETARDIFGQVVEAVFLCKVRGVLHGDIKDENIMIDEETGVVKLIDFGSGQSYLSRECEEYSGTREWAPPEWVRGRTFTAEGVTVWSLGVLLYDMLCGDIPFQTDQQILCGTLIWQQHLSLSATVRRLVESCLCSDQGERMTLQQLRHHPWIHQAASIRRNKRSFNLALLSSLSSSY